MCRYVNGWDQMPIMNNNIYHILIMCVCWTVCIPAHNKNQSASEFDFPKWSNHLRHRQRGSANVCCCCLVDVIQLEVWGWTRMKNWPIPRFALFKCNLSSAAFCHLSHPRDRSYVWFDPLCDQFLLVKTTTSSLKQQRCCFKLAKASMFFGCRTPFLLLTCWLHNHTCSSWFVSGL